MRLNNKSAATITATAIAVLFSFNLQFQFFVKVSAAPIRIRIRMRRASRKSLQTLAFHHSRSDKINTHRTSALTKIPKLQALESHSLHSKTLQLHVGKKLKLEPYTCSSHPSLTSRLFATSSSPPASHQDINMKHFNSLDSTQNEAKKILHDQSSHEPKSYLAVTTASQTKGRGTKNRTWIGRKGNTFLTVAIPSNDLKIPLTLLPLQIGNLLAQQVQDMLKFTNAAVKLKWPNDVLVDQKKIAGVLIESEQDHAGNYYFLVGIGVNYKFAPKVETSGQERGRVTTCICDFIDADDDDDGVEAARELGWRIAKDVREWVELQKNWDGAADSIMTAWETWAEFGNKLILRDDPGNETVVPLSLEKDGRLRVKGQNGKERLLCFEYLL